MFTRMIEREIITGSKKTSISHWKRWSDIRFVAPAGGGGDSNLGVLSTMHPYSDSHHDGTLGH
jgi:hypothetical protein